MKRVGLEVCRRVWVWMFVSVYKSVKSWFFRAWGETQFRIPRSRNYALLSQKRLIAQHEAAAALVSNTHLNEALEAIERKKK